MGTELKSAPRGPKGNFLLGCATSFVRNPLRFLERTKQDFGNLVSFELGPVPTLLINEPDLIEEVLVTQAHCFIKELGLRNNRRFFGNGLLSSEGEYWRKQRRLAAPSFSPKRLEGYGQVMVDHTADMCRRWTDKQIVDIQHEMMQLTLGIAVKTLFDVELDPNNHELESALTNSQAYLADRINNIFLMMLPEWLPFPTNLGLSKEVATVEKFIYGLIAERRGRTEGRNDLLSILVAARDEEDGTTMSDRQVRDEIFTFFFAGHETTALSLTWALYLISQHPEVEQRLLEEIKQVLGGGVPKVSNYYQLSYTNKVIKESMRIRPPVWSFGRECIKDCSIGDYEVKDGTTILLSQWLMHHDERYYADPHSFNPDRWSEEFANHLPKFAYFPFGGGPRICIGNGFAMLESVLALATIMQNFHIELAQEKPVELLPAVTLRPKGGIAMKLTRRSFH